MIFKNDFLIRVIMFSRYHLPVTIRKQAELKYRNVVRNHKPFPNGCEHNFCKEEI